MGWSSRLGRRHLAAKPPMQPLNVTNDRINDRAKARTAARELAEIALAEIASTPPHAHACFWDELRAKLPQLKAPNPQIPKSLAAEPFTDAQARAWGRNTMQFGKHQGTPIDQVPLDYLERIAEPNEFTRYLRRYLASRRIQHESDQAAGD